MPFYEAVWAILFSVSGLGACAVVLVMHCKLRQAKRLEAESSRLLWQRACQELEKARDQIEAEQRGQVRPPMSVPPKPTPKEIPAVEDLSRPMEDVVKEAEQKAIEQWKEDYPHHGW